MNVMKFHKIGDPTKTMRVRISQKKANLESRSKSSRQLCRTEAIRFAASKGYARSGGAV